MKLKYSSNTSSFTFLGVKISKTFGFYEGSKKAFKPFLFFLKNLRRLLMPYHEFFEPLIP